MDDLIEVEKMTLDTSEALREIALEMALNCRRTLDIVSRQLDPAIYDHAPFVEAVKQIALGNRLARIRFLVTDVAPIVARGHRLLELSARLPSFIFIRKPGREHKNFNEEMLLDDNSA